MDPYQTLNVPRGASDAEIKKAFRNLAAQHHPDKGGDEEQFKKINEAYSVIGTHEKRQEYEASQNSGGFGDVFGGFGDIFEGFFGNHSHTKRKSTEQTDDEIVFDLKVSLAQIKKGVSQDVVFERDKKCNKCKGAGGKNKRMCGSCMGQGMQVVRMGPIIQQTTCRTCFGKGFSFEEECYLCQGAGMIKVKENIKFTIENK